MVNIHVNDNNNQIRINVPGINNTVSTQSTNPNNNVSSTIGNETFYNGLAKEWAISPNLVQGIDYSSKYYAGKAKESADIAESAIEDIGTAKDEAIDDISDAKTDAISDMETAKTEKITEIENTASDFEDDLTLLTQRAETAATNAQNSADYIVNNAPTATVTQTSTGATITTKDLTHGTTTANILNGAKGDKGDKGDQGEQGIQGIQGIQGEQGIQGIQGEQGEKGDKGDKGDTGDDGYSPTATVSKSGNTATITITDKNGTTTANVYDGVGSITDVQVDGTSVLDGSIAKIDLTGKYDASNPDGFISDITSSDVITALGYTPYNATNPNNYITASALTGYATEQWVSNQNYVNSTTLATTLLDYVTNTSLTTTLADYQPLLVSGTNIKTINNTSILGSGDITIQSAPDVDEISITTNSDDELQTVGVIDQNNTANAIKTWTGTRTQYDAIVTKDANTLYWLTDVKIIYLGDVAVGNFKGGRNVGELVYSSLPLTDAGLHLLDGSLILGGGIYQGFVDYIAELYGDGTNIPSYFCTESEWQTSVNTYGVCGKFVYDSVANTVRLPKVTGIVEGTTDLTALGDLVEAGLPVHTHTRGTMNITGYIGGGLGAYNGAFYHGWSYSGSAADGGGSVDDVGSFDASRTWAGNTSNPIYTNNIQNSSTVQPQAIKVLYYIVIANSTKTEIQSDIDEIATDLNGKADIDLTNVTDTGYIKMAGAGMPSNKYINLTLGASNSQYTAPANGWLVIWSTGANTWLAVHTIEVYGPSLVSKEISGVTGPRITLPLQKNQIFQIGYGGTVESARFYYAQGSESEAQ